jgi:PAS domain-containing protein
MKAIFPSAAVVWFKRSLPLLFLGLVVGIESGATYFFGHQTLAPLLSILFLSILAFYCSPRLLLLSTPLFMILTYLLIRDHSDYPLVRAFTVILGGILAVWVSSSRNKLQRQQTEIETIVNLMPIPWLLADASGNLLRISPELQKLLGPARPNLINTPFFSLFSAAQNRGEFIRLFLDTSDNSVTHSGLNLTLANPPHTRFVAVLSSLPSPSGHSILIILNPSAS